MQNHPSIAIIYWRDFSWYESHKKAGVFPMWADILFPVFWFLTCVLQMIPEGGCGMDFTIWYRTGGYRLGVGKYSKGYSEKAGQKFYLPNHDILFGSLIAGACITIAMGTLHLAVSPMVIFTTAGCHRLCTLKSSGLRCDDSRQYHEGKFRVDNAASFR